MSTRRAQNGCASAAEASLDAAPAGGTEPHALPLALDDDPGGDALHPAGGEALRDLAPQHRRYLVAVEAVEDAPGLLGVDEAAVELAGVLDGGPDGGWRDLVEDHAHHRHPGREHLGEVPGDRLAFAVLVCCEVDLARGARRGGAALRPVRAFPARST